MGNRQSSGGPVPHECEREIKPGLVYLQAGKRNLLKYHKEWVETTKGEGGRADNIDMVAQTGSLRRESLSWLDWLAWMAVVACALAAIGYSSDPDEFMSAAGLAAAGGYSLGGLLLFRYGRRSSAPDGRSFALIGVGTMGGGAGMVIVGIAAEFTEVAAFGPFDLIFIGVYLVLLAALVSMPTVNLGWRSQARIVLDALVGSVSLITLLWGVAGDSIIENLSGLSPVQRAIGMTYPVLDLALLVGIMVVILRRGQFQFDVRLVALLVGFGFQASADLSFLANATSGTFNDATPNLLLYLAASTMIVLSGLVARLTPPPLEVEDRRTPIWSYAIPYAVAVLLVGFHLADVFRGSGGDLAHVIETVVIVLVMLLVIIRQSLAIHENQTKVEEERRSLIASVSHELRTPLTSLIGFLTVLDESGDVLSDDERSELSDVVLEQANYMGRMVTDIIMLARDKPQDMALVETPIAVSNLVSSVLDTLGAKAASVTVEYEEGISVRVDTDRVKQVMVNLLTNANRYGSGRAKLLLKTHFSDVIIEVHDNGSGVPKKYQQVIWERFERGGNELNAGTPGTGLGLSIVDMIVRAHYGSASYRKSELLGGACFSVTLPARVITDYEAEEPASSLPPVSVRTR